MKTRRTRLPSNCLLAYVSFIVYGIVYSVAHDERIVGTIPDDKTIASKIEYSLLNNDSVKGLDISAYCFPGKTFIFLN